MATLGQVKSGKSKRSDPKPLDEHEIVGYLANKIDQAMNDDDGDLSDVRKENLNYYVGAEYGDEREGYSKFVTREVLETVEWVMPSVLRVFLSGDRIVSFTPESPEDEDGAKQETDITNHFVMKSCNSGAGSFLALHHWVKDCLMYPNGYIKAYMTEVSKSDVGTVSGLNEMGVKMLADDPDVEILEQRSRTVQVPAPPPQMQPPGPPGAPQQPGALPLPPGGIPAPGMMPMEVYDLKIRTTKQQMELRIEAVPGEEVLVDNDCTSTNLDEAKFVCHRTRKSFTQLVEEGYDADELNEVGNAEDYQWNDERTNRLFYEDEDPDTGEDDDDSMRQFWVHECYAWLDANGDGLAEHRKVTLIGHRIFDDEETNYQPLVAMSAILMQHKHNGMGFIEIVKDLQLLGSVLHRQMLDNIYKVNVHKKYFSEDALTQDGATMEALLNTQAEYVPVRGPAQQAVYSDVVPSMAGEILPVIQHLDTQRASRTGITPEAGVAANDLQEVRQEVFSNAMDRASQRIEMLVRIFAETGFRQLMLKVHQLLRSHWDIPKAIKLRGEWVDVDPQGWRDRTDMTVEVGLGFHTKQQQMGMLVQLLQIQKEAAGNGLSNPEKIYHGLEKLINAGGLGDVRSFFVKPGTPEYQPPEPPPDPNMILAQAQAQALQMEQQRKMQELQLKFQTDGMKAQAEAQKSQAEAQAKAAEREIKLRELALKEFELQENSKFSTAELEAKIDEIRASAQLKRSQSDKAMADAAATAVEASETYQQAAKIVSQGGEMNDPGYDVDPDSIEFEEDDNGSERQTDTED